MFASEEISVARKGKRHKKDEDADDEPERYAVHTPFESFEGTSPALGKHSYREAFGERDDFVDLRDEWRPAAVDVHNLATIAHSYHGEDKHLEYMPAGYAASSAGVVELLNGIAVGATSITRNGNQVTWKRVMVRGYMYPVDTTTAAHRTDLYIIWDTQPGAAVPATADILQGAGTKYFTNYDNRMRFTTLAHRSFISDAIDTTAQSSYSGHNSHLVEIYKKINLKTTFKGDGNTIADIATGAMYVLAVGSGAAAYSTVAITFRLIFNE